MVKTSLVEEAFAKYATVEREGARYLSLEDFSLLLVPSKTLFALSSEEKAQGAAILFAIADRKKRGLLSLEDFLIFQNLLSHPDAEYQIAYRLFDVNGDGKVEADEFRQLLSRSADNRELSLHFDSDWFQLFVDPSSHEIPYHSFVQLLKGLQDEKIKQAFKNHDPEGTGGISIEDFSKIFRTIQRHKLTHYISVNLPTLENFFGNKPISYPVVVAFNNVMRELDLLEHVVREASWRHPKGFSREQFVEIARAITRFSRFTPLEFDLLFHFASLENNSALYSFRDFERILDPHYDMRNKSLSEQQHDEEELLHAQKHSFAHDALKQAYSFGLGSIAGAIGATCVYPIDLVKTRMQNQRKMVGEILYKNSWDCFQKVLKNEGVRGLYRGLGPQLVGVAPEKAIKLTVNDLMRETFKNKETNQIALIGEIAAGGMAGGCQVIFTNPLEIIKIRLQILGELAAKEGAAPRASAIEMVRKLGLVGLYKGASACLLRDIPFSAIYFPTYAHVKKVMGETPERKLSGLQLLLSGALAGMPAAYLCTPADVIKTRLQVEARKGQQTYTGIVDAFKKILQQEGWKAFFKGGPARVLRSSPQFGFTLLSYEVLQRNFPLYDPSSPSSSSSSNLASQDSSDSPLSFLPRRWTSALGGYDPTKNTLPSLHALQLLMDIDQKFGVWPLPSHVQKAAHPAPN